MIDHHVVIWFVVSLIFILAFLKTVEGYSQTGEKKCSYT